MPILHNDVIWFTEATQTMSLQDVPRLSEVHLTITTI